jgi:myo-inositol-1(or 4)-monophosphatase
MKLTDILKGTEEIAREAGGFIRGQRALLTDDDIRAKGIHDYVTRVDKESEERLVKGLSALLPGSGFITEEETTEQKEAEYTWIIDPLDGTTNFIHGSPPYAVSIALQHRGCTVAGVVYEISMDEMFSASEEDAPALNGETIHTSRTASLQDVLLATGFPFINFDRLDPYMEVLKRFMAETQGVRRLGSAATDLAWVACGRYDGFYEYNLHAWDVAAGAFLVQRAGGRVADFRGGDDYLFGREMVAAAPGVYEEIATVIREYLG